MPTHEELVNDLKDIRKSGIREIYRLDLPWLEQAVIAAGRVAPTEKATVRSVENFIRDIVPDLGDVNSEAAAIVLGLTNRDGKPSDNRRFAADIIGISLDRFRKAHEPAILNDIAHLMLVEIDNYRLRHLRLKAEIRSAPESRLAIEWLKRFEGMYKVWAALAGVGNDLTAFRQSLIHEGEDGESPEDLFAYARRYAINAVFHFQRFLVEENDFDTRHGGLWLLPSATDEKALANALHEIRMLAPQGWEDQSYFRQFMRTLPDDELATWLEAIHDDEPKREIVEDWIIWAANCECYLDVPGTVGREYWPLPANHPEVYPNCRSHKFLAAVHQYLLLVDDGWSAVADFYA